MADLAVRMPDVDTPPDIEELFKKAWRLASEGPEIASLTAAPADQRSVIIVTPGRALMIQPCPRPGTMPQSAIDSIEKIAPSGTYLNIAVIAFTQLDALMKNKAQAIPFLGYVLGFAYVGHNVIVFEGHPSALAVGCRNADLLIVDEAMVPHLQRDWAKVAWAVMRAKRIFIFGRNGTVKQIVEKPST